MAKTWIKNGVTASGTLYTDTNIIINASDEQWLANGWVEYIAPQPSAEELARQEALSEIESLKEQLAESDYKAIKFAEGWFTKTEYATIKAERQALRDRINELEQTLETEQ